MKKLMVMAGVIALAAVSQAGVIKWGVSNNSWADAKGNAYPAKDTLVYLINGDTALDTIAAAINSETGAFDTSVDWYYETAKTSNTKGNVTSHEIANTSKLTAGTEYNFSALIIDQDANGKWMYMVSDVAAQKAYNSGETPLSVSFGSTKFGDNALTADLPGASNGWAAVPEPTSAMLLLLGVAGLALRRRRA